MNALMLTHIYYFHGKSQKLMSKGQRLLCWLLYAQLAIKIEIIALDNNKNEWNIWRLVVEIKGNAAISMPSVRSQKTRILFYLTCISSLLKKENEKKMLLYVSIFLCKFVAYPERIPINFIFRLVVK